MRKANYTAQNVGKGSQTSAANITSKRKRKEEEENFVTAADIHGMLTGEHVPGATDTENNTANRQVGRVDMSADAMASTAGTTAKRKAGGDVFVTAEDVHGMLEGRRAPAGKEAEDLENTRRALGDTYDAWQQGRKTGTDIGQGKPAKIAAMQALKVANAPAQTEKAVDNEDDEQTIWQRLGRDLKGLGQQFAGSYMTFAEANTDKNVWANRYQDWLATRYADQAAQAREQGQEDEAKVWDQYAEQARSKKRDTVMTPETSAGMRLYQKGGEEIERALEGVGGPARFAADVANSVVSNLPSMAAAAIPVVGPAVSLGTMGAQAAGGRTAELSAEGRPLTEAANRGLLSGGIEIATESIPVGNWAEMLRGNGKSIAKNILSQMGEEGTEEAVSYLANYAADVAAQDPNAEFSLEELVESAAMGAASGGIYGAAGAGIGRLAERGRARQQTQQEQQQTIQAPAESAEALRRDAQGEIGPDTPAEDVQELARAAQESQEAPGQAPDAIERTRADERQQAEQAADAVARAEQGDPAAMQEALTAFERQRAAQQAQAVREDPVAAVQADPRFAADEGITLTPAQDRLYRAGVETMRMSEQAAQRMAATYDGKGDATEHARAWQAMYRVGQLGLAENAEQAAKRAGQGAAQLDADVRRLAFGQGQAEAAVYPFSDQAQAVQTVAEAADANARYTDEMRAAVKEGYTGGSPTVYLQAMKGMYDAGRTGALDYSQALAANRSAAAMVGDADTLRRAYDLGAASVQAVADMPGRGAVQGTVQYEGGAGEGSTKLPAEVLNAIASKLGTHVRVVQNLTDGAGEEVNGHWAAALSELALGEGSGNAYQTAVHELTHYMGSNNAEGWARLRGAILGWYAGERGMGTTQREVLGRYEAAYGDSALAADEAARDLWSGVLSSEEGTRSFLEYLADDETMTVPEKRSVLQTLRDILDRVLESIRALLRGGDATVGAAEGRRLAEREEQLTRSRELVQDFLKELETARQNAQAKASETQATAGTEQQQNTAAGKMPAAASEAVRFSVSEEYRGLEKVMREAIPTMEDMEPVCTVKTDKTMRGPKENTALEREFFEKLGGKIHVPGLGTVYLTNSGARNDVAHGAGPAKMATIYAIPDVLQKGELIDRNRRWKGRNYNSYTFMAPVTIEDGGKGQRTYVGAIVRENTSSDGTKSFYLHEVVDANGNRVIFEQNERDTATNIAGQQSGGAPVTGDPDGISTNTIQENGKNVKHSRPVTDDDSRPASERLEEARQELQEIRKQRQALQQEQEEFDSQPRFQEMLAERPKTGGRGLLDWLRKWRNTAEYKERNEKLGQIREKEEPLSEREYDLEKRMRKLQDEEQDENWRKNVAADQAAYDEEVEDSGLTVEEYRRELAADTYGTTEDFREAGYILPDGRMLDFSEAREPGTRAIDHREIESVFGPAELGRNERNVKAMNAFIADGNVRVMAGTPGVDISNNGLPSEEQLERIAEMADTLGAAQRRFGIDISDADGRQVAQKWYEGRVRGARVVEDIRAYFENGVLPESDELDAFRYSREAGDNGRTELERENRALAWQVSHMGEQIERLREEMRVSEGHKMNPGVVKDLAGRILRDYESRYDRAQLERELHRVFENIANNSGDMSYEEAMETCTNLMRDVLSQSTRVNTELRDYYRPVREALRNTTIEVQKNSPIYNDLLYAYGDGEGGAKWGNVRRATFGRLNLKLVDGPGNADTAFMELAEQYPAVFDAEAAASDNVAAALGVFEASAPAYENPYGLDLDAAAAFAGQELFEAYMTTPERHTYADRQRQRMLELKGEYRRQRQQALAEQKARYEKKLDELRTANAWRQAQRVAKTEEHYEAKLAEMREHNRGRVADVRAEMTDKMLQQKAAFDVRMERRNEGMRWRQARDGVQKSVQRLRRWLTAPTDQAHVQDKMRRAVVNLLNSFDWNTSREGSRAAVRWQEAMKDIRMLALEMDNEQLGGEMDYVDFDPDLPAMIDELIEAGKGEGRIADLDAMQMQQLRGVLETVTKSITEANKLMAEGRAADLNAVGDRTLEQLDEAKRRQLRTKNKLVAKLMDTKAADTVAGLAGLDMMDAGSYFTSLGEEGGKVYRAIRNGFDKRVWKLRDAQQAMTDILKGHDIKTWTGPKAAKRSFLGGRLELTPGQVMELYALSQRPQARDHLMRGGVSIDLGDGKKGARVQLTPEDLAEICGSLTPEQVKVADAMQKYLSTDVAGWGNEVSMAMYGVRKFREAHYWPIKTDSNFTRTSDATENPGGMWAIKNQGFTKAVQVKANNAIILHDAFDTWSEHVANMATYNAWAIPLSDAMKWYNWRAPQNGASIKEGIETLYGQKGKTYFVNLMKDINGTSGKANPTSTEKLMGALVPRWKVAKVGANLRVAIQQPTAYLRAGAVMNPKYLATALAKAPAQVRRGMAEAERNCAIAQWKSWGYFETNIGQSMRSILTGQQTPLENIQDKSTLMAELGDKVTWGTLWLACEEETKATHPELKAGSDAFKGEVARRLGEVIDKTQVVDTVLHRSQVMRSKNQVVQMEMNFMAEPTKTWNLLREAAVDLAQGKAGSRAKFARTMAAFTVTALGTAAAAGLIDAVRVGDDDRDKDFAERYFAAVQANFADGVNVLSNLPMFKSILSLAEGYDVERTDLAAISDFFEAANAWMNTMKGKGKATYYSLAYKTANVVAEVTGIPVGAAVREVKSMYDMLTGLQDPLHVEESIVTGNADMHAALKRGDVEHAQALLDELAQKKVDDGKTPKEAKSSLRSSLTSYWKPLYVAGDTAARRDIADKLLALRCNGEAIYTQGDLDKWLK